MIIESAAAYALVLLLYAIEIIVPSFSVSGSPMDLADYYIEVIVTVVSMQGMAPTILVARIALTDPNRTEASATLTHISGDLQFKSQQGSGSDRNGNTTGADVNASVQADNAQPTPVIEVKRESRTDVTSGDNQV
ncbi:hypothetical protein CVT25_007540 [Psilocybe cyanescens]|uniref:Uncharacterized protein n=1 Tax=Psilocybe cyanescens TaxID=93625 RepID=A0A409X1Z4_PSICY|nr:hypothetical protein CVT25_007540 [Psilocybe cyanescens]